MSFTKLQDSRATYRINCICKCKQQSKIEIKINTTYKKLKYWGINLTKDERSVHWKIQTTAERIWRGPKEMEGFFLFMSQKTRFCENASSPQINLQSHQKCNRHQNPSRFMLWGFLLVETDKLILFHMEITRTQDSQNKFARENSWKTNYLISRLTIKLK